VHEAVFVKIPVVYGNELVIVGMLEGVEEGCVVLGARVGGYVSPSGSVGSKVGAWVGLAESH